MGFRYAVLGSGRQGTAAAYDLARLGEADFVVLADQFIARGLKDGQECEVTVDLFDRYDEIRGVLQAGL